MIRPQTIPAVSRYLENRRRLKKASRPTRASKSNPLSFSLLEQRQLLTTFVVDTLVDDASGATDGLVSLREAIVAANTNEAFGDAVAGAIDGDRIEFDPSLLGGTISLTAGELEVTDDLIIQGGDLGLTIDAQGLSRIFNLGSSGGLIGINNLELTNGVADQGGAIQNLGPGTTRLTNVTLTNNTATGLVGGGGIFTDFGNLFATNLVATGNVASGTSGSGGALLQLSGRVGLFDSVLQSNVANRAGGGIEVVDGSFFASDITLGATGLGNIAGPEGSAAPGNGGGFHITGTAFATFLGGSVTGNIAALEGGGLWNQVGSRLVLSDIDITENVALGDGADDGGGGVFNNGGDLLITNGTTISDNSATGTAGSGGGIFSTDGDVTIIESEISSNVANRAGGGIELIDGQLILRRSVLGGPLPSDGNIAGPEGSASPGNGGGLHVTGNLAQSFIQDSNVSYNVAASEGGGLWNQAGSLLRVDRGSLIANNVASGDAADNGGGGIFNNGGRVTVLSSTLSENSADGAAGSGGGLFSTDGNILIVGSLIELNDSNRAGGGFEIVDGRLDVLGSTVVGNSTGTVGNVSSAAPGNGGGLHVTGLQTRTVVRDSFFSANVAASEGGGLWNQSGSTLIFDDSTVRGNSALGNAADNGGGGLFNNGGNLLVSDSFVLDNTALGTAGSGGGIFSTSGTLSVNDSNISRNSANRAGGGIEVIDGSNRVEDSIFNVNLAGGSDASPGNGGAVHVSGNNSRFAIIDSFFGSNTATNQGGALWNQTDSLLFLGGTNVINGSIAQNGVGGGIYNRGRLLAQNAVVSFGRAVDGGGVFNTPTGQSFLSGFTLRGNFASNVGGGIANAGLLTVTDSLFENNSASDGGAIADLDASTFQQRNTFQVNTPNNVA